jgi:hypothetical protein
MREADNHALGDERAVEAAVVLPERESDDEFPVAAKARHQPGVPEHDRHHQNEGHEHERVHLCGPVEHLGQPALLVERHHQRRELPAVAPVGEVERGGGAARLVAPVRGIPEEAENLARRVVHVQRAEDVGDVGNHRAPIHHRHAEPDDARDDEIPHDEAAVHRRADERGGGARVEAEAGGKDVAEEDLAWPLGQAASHDGFVEIEEAALGACGIPQVDGQTRNRALGARGAEEGGRQVEHRLRRVDALQLGRDQVALRISRALDDQDGSGPAGLGHGGE